MSILQLSRLLPLPDDELQQILDYASTLTKPAAAEHLSGILGTEPPAVAFISSFNGKRKDAPGSPAPSGNGAGGRPAAAGGSGSRVEPAPKARRGGRKEKAPLHVPEPRRLGDMGTGPGKLYSKEQTDLEYIPRSKKSSPAPTPAPVPGGSAAQHTQPQAAAAPVAPNPTPSPQPAAPKRSQQSGFLISDPATKPKAKSNGSSRSSTPSRGATTTKVSISGGTPMKGASTALTDLDSAIRALELSTDLRGTGDRASRRCNCVATRHPLQTAAPNCLACGKVVCVKEGLGPCTTCGAPLLTGSETEAILKQLKFERGKERQAADRAAHRRPEVSKAPAPFKAVRDGGFGRGGAGGVAEAEAAAAEARAREHRDRLLAYQAENAQRTTVRDEVADFDVGAAMGGSVDMWASPAERAAELKRQQKMLREMEWEARPEYEKRRQVISIDLVGRKVVKKMAAVERPPSPASEDDEEVEEEDYYEDYGEGANGEAGGYSRKGQQGGAFSRNPLLGQMLKPVYNSKGKGRQKEEAGSAPKWRRVQDDMDDNEGVILDGGVHGHSEGVTTAGDEPVCG